MRPLRAPLVHFAAGGAALFWLAHGAALLHAGRTPPAPVVLRGADVARLRDDYARDTGILPTAADESALIEKSIDEELLFREALARGLDRNDRSVRTWLLEQMRALRGDEGGDDDRLVAEARALGLDHEDLVVRRILVQKMRLLAAREGEQPPREEELRAYYEARRDEYRAPARTSFWQVFVSASRGAATRADAEAILARLRGADGPAGAQSGDAFSVPPHAVGMAPAQLERLFGPDLATAVTTAEARSWVGPLASPYGLHLIWVEARESAAAPDFGAVRSRVLERWYDETREQRVRALLAGLRARTPLEVDSAAWRQRSAS